MGKDIICKSYNTENIRRTLKTPQQKDKQPKFLTRASDLSRYLVKEDIKMANKQMERCSVLLTIRENASYNHSEIPFHTH